MRLSQPVLSNYLISKIIYNFSGIFLILSLIIFGNQFFLVAKESVEYGFLTSEIFPLVLLKLLRDFPTLFNFSVFAAIVVTLKRLGDSSEKIILHSNSIGDYQIFKLISKFVFFALTISLLGSLFLSPSAKKEINNLKLNSSNRPEYIFLKEGQITEFDNNIIFAEQIIPSENSEDLIKIYLIKSDEWKQKVITAPSGKKIIDQNNNIKLQLFNGSIYEISDNAYVEQISQFKYYESSLFVENSVKHNNSDKLESKNLFELLSDSSRQDLIELNLRISQPISLLILTIIGVAISASNPKKTSNKSILTGLIFFIVYFNLIFFFKDLADEESNNLYILFAIPHIIFLVIVFIIFNLKYNFIQNLYVNKTPKKSRNICKS